MKLKHFPLFVLLLLSLLIAGCNENIPAGGPTADGGKSPGKPPAVNQQTPETMKLTLYYATKDAMNLVAEVHEIPRTNHPAQTALELLATPPVRSDLVAVLPAGTKVRGISVKEQIAYVDFSDTIIKKNPGGSASEALLVGAVVNTLTEFHDIHKVQILVEGKKLETLTGHVDISAPLSRSETVIKKS